MSKVEKTRSFICPRCRLVIELSFWSSWPQPTQGGDCPNTADGRHTWSRL